MSKPVRANLGGSNRLLSFAEAASYIGSTADSLKVNYRKWGIPAVRGPGRRVQFRERSLNIWIEAHEDERAS